MNDWIAALRAEREDALAELHALLLRAARFELRRRGAGSELDDLAHQCADDALVAVLAKLDDFRGDSRFTTWAYKFALLEAAVKRAPARLAATARCRSTPRAGPRSTTGARRRPSESEASCAPRCDAIGRVLTPHQRDGARRAGAQGRADRRAGRALRDHPRRAVQDPPRRAGAAARASLTAAGLMERGMTDDRLRQAARPGRARGHLRRVLRAARRLRRAELAGRDADALMPGMRAHLDGCPACAEDHESLLELARQGT